MMAVSAMATALAIGGGIIILGMFSDALSARVVAMTTFATFFVGGLFGIVGWYWKLGSSETLSSNGGSGNSGGVDRRNG